MSNPEPVPELQPEPETTSEPEPEVNIYREPEPEPESSPIPTQNIAYAEPLPEWPQARETFSFGWEIHIYTIGILAVILFMLSSTMAAVIARKRTLKSRWYYVTLLLLMMFFALVRAIMFFVDAYNLGETFPSPLAFILLNVGFPCLISAFYILFAALFKVTRQLRRIRPEIFTFKWLITFNIIFFTTSISTDLIAGFFIEARVLSVICEGVFVFASLLLSIGFLYLFVRLYLDTVVSRKRLFRSVNPNRDANLYKDPVDITVIITAVAAALLLIFALVHLIGLVWLVSSPSGYLPAWPWWVYHYCLRLNELTLAYIMVFVTWLPMMRTQRARQDVGKELSTRTSQVKQQRSLISNEDINTKNESNA